MPSNQHDVALAAQAVRELTRLAQDQGKFSTLMAVVNGCALAHKVLPQEVVEKLFRTPGLPYPFRQLLEEEYPQQFHEHMKEQFLKSTPSSTSIASSGSNTNLTVPPGTIVSNQQGQPIGMTTTYGGLSGSSPMQTSFTGASTTGMPSAPPGATPFVPASNSGGASSMGSKSLAPMTECKKVVTADPYTVVEQDATGELVCNMHRTLDWCSHVQEVIEKGWDAGWPYEVLELRVPIVPDLDVWAHVIIDQAVTAGGKKVYVKGKKKSDLFVGYTTPEEGRLVLRSMLHNWALPRFREPGMPKMDGILAECRVAKHGVEAENALKNPQSNQHGLANMWLVVAEGMCLYCRDLFDTAGDVPQI